MNLCPIFETKSKCPHGQRCLYPHKRHKQTDVEIDEPRYFEVITASIDESNKNELFHIIPKRRAPILDLPSYIPLKL